MAHFFSDGAVADNTTFVVVGAAAVLGAACRAPLTAIALMVEISRDTGLLVPLLAAIGTASVVTDYLVSGEGRDGEWALRVLHPSVSFRMQYGTIGQSTCPTPPSLYSPPHSAGGYVQQVAGAAASGDVPEGEGHVLGGGARV